MRDIFRNMAKLREFILYCFCGVVGVTTDYIVFLYLLKLDLWYQSANFLGYLSGTFVSFFLNRKFTFAIKDKVYLRLIKFLMVGAAGYSSSVIMLWLLVDLALLKAEIAKLILLPVIVIIQYSINRKITFKASK